MDLIIKDGTVIDGSGAPGLKADLGIKDDRIEVLGKLNNCTSAAVIQAGGKVVCPGFIDIHSHSDYHLLINPQSESKIRQGVTTEVGGNCGYAAAPIGNQELEERQVRYKETFDLELDWQTLPEYRRRLEKAKISVNYAPLIGHNTIRATVMGMENRPPTSRELTQMAALMEEAMQDGAFGISSGLIYPPACYARAPELIALCKAAARYGGFLSCHMRSEGPRLLEALDEIILVARKARIPLQISHLKTAGGANWHKLPQAFEMIEKAQDQGVPITADSYPYLASNAGLQALLPDWALAGGTGAQLKRLQNQSTRRRIQKEILANHPEEEYWEKILISEAVSEENQRWVGNTVAEAAARQAKPPLEFVFDLLLQESMHVEAIYFIMSENNLLEILSKPYVMIGSDSACRAHYGPLSKGKPHPRAFGTFPRVLDHYVNKEGVLNMEEAVYKMTGAPAQILGLKDRGRIREGFKADIVVFDPQKIHDTATYQNPASYPEGIDCVIVNGAITVENGSHSGIGKGCVLVKGN
ncbi:MAG: D-aminoacylase [Proteobacteria bacterium]|nr:D-aminoacylase [Pseudomonadota bacterium]MBU2226348.1 D-aminoacylase [Pseudomonadota bacterium]